MIAKINESKTGTKHVKYECKCKFNDRICNSNLKWNNDKCRCECKNLKESVFILVEFILVEIVFILVEMVNI